MRNCLDKVQVFFFPAGPAKIIMMCLSAVPSLLQPLPAHALLPSAALPAQSRGMRETQCEMDQSQITFTLLPWLALMHLSYLVWSYQCKYSIISLVNHKYLCMVCLALVYDTPPHSGISLCISLSPLHSYKLCKVFMECSIQAMISSVVCVYKTTTLYGYTA